MQPTILEAGITAHCVFCLRKPVSLTDVETMTPKNWEVLLFVSVYNTSVRLGGGEHHHHQGHQEHRGSRLWPERISSIGQPWASPLSVAPIYRFYNSSVIEAFFVQHKSHLSLFLTIVYPNQTFVWCIMGRECAPTKVEFPNSSSLFILIIAFSTRMPCQISSAHLVLTAVSIALFSKDMCT